MKIEGVFRFGVTCALALTVGGCLFASAPDDGGTGTDAGGGDAGAGDPCEGVTCSGAGRCIDLGDGYECICELGFDGPDCERCAFGYEPEGDECVLESLCEMFQCPGAQSCFEVDGAPECVCDGGLVALDDGACVSACEVPELNTCLEREVCVDEGGVVECVPQANTCERLRRSGLATEDGEYVLFYEGDFEQPWTVYCHDLMGRAEEYLPLPATRGFRNLFEEHSHNRQTSYTRVRIDPSNLRVNAEDNRFANTDDLIGPSGPPDSMYRGNVYFGTTGSCGVGRDNGDPPGRGTIDLTGTPFFVESEFAFGGVCARGPEPRYLERDQVVELEASGSCGYVAPRVNANVAGNVCPDDPSLDRLPYGGSQSTFTIQLGYSADLLEP